ncbi:MAG TPA: SAM-dependent chlorinase/fluorinase, partial [Mycobacteriales bacterium]
GGVPRRTVYGMVPGAVTGYDWVSFTTDYGLTDGFVAACKGVLAGIAPAARVIDVTHDVPPQDVRRGATVLAQTVLWLPEAVHLAVVDPGVGTDRRGIAVRTPRGVLVGPDNGLLVPAAVALGGITAAYELADPRYQLPEVSRTFHGRDVFAPVAGHLCRGLDPALLGPEVDPGRLVTLSAPRTELTPGLVLADVLAVDRYGNVQLAATGGDLAAAGLEGTVLVCGRPAVLGKTFADAPPGELVVLVDSAGQAAVAVNGDSAASALGVEPGDRVDLSAAGR